MNKRKTYMHEEKTKSAFFISRMIVERKKKREKGLKLTVVTTVSAKAVSYCRYCKIVHVFSFIKS